MKFIFFRAVLLPPLLVPSTRKSTHSKATGAEVFESDFAVCGEGGFGFVFSELIDF